MICSIVVNYENEESNEWSTCSRSCGRACFELRSRCRRSVAHRRASGRHRRVHVTERRALSEGPGCASWGGRCPSRGPRARVCSLRREVRCRAPAQSWRRGPHAPTLDRLWHLSDFRRLPECTYMWTTHNPAAIQSIGEFVRKQRENIFRRWFTKGLGLRIT